MTMIRELVDVVGHVRPMEPTYEIEALKMPCCEIGIMKEAPVKRWLAGQEAWDKKYHRSALKVVRKRQHYERKAATLIEHARQQGLVLSSDRNLDPPNLRRSWIRTSLSSVGDVEQDRRWGMCSIFHC